MNFFEPATVDEAVEILAANPAALCLADGTWGLNTGAAEVGMIGATASIAGAGAAKPPEKSFAGCR